MTENVNPNEMLSRLRDFVAEGEMQMLSESTEQIDFAETLDSIAVAFHELDDWLSNGGELPVIWKS